MSGAERETEGIPTPASPELFEALFDMSPDPTVVHDGECVIMANRAATQFFGIDRREVVGRPIGSFVHPEHHSLVSSRAQIMKQTMNAAPRAELTLLRADGASVEVEASSAPIETDSRRVIVTVFRDLTERRRYEQSLLASEARFRSVVECVPLGMHMYRLESDGRLVFIGANPAADRMLGVDNAAFVGKTIEDAFPALVHTEVPARYREIAETGKTWSTNQIDYQEGSIRGAFEVHAFQTAPNHMVAMFADVTERLQTQAQLQQLLAERTEALAAAHRELDVVISIVSRTVELRDPYTAGHQRRVAQLCAALAEDLGLEAEQVERMRVAGSVHDIGKLSVPAEILSKPGRLSDVEYELVKYHSVAAKEILSSVEFDWPLTESVHQHHERMDGSGYPRGLRGDEIEFGARVLAVADVVEAMCSHRPYRPALGVDEALAEIVRGSATLFDEQVVESCLRVFSDGFSFE